MIDDRHLALLKELSTDAASHSGRTLLEHLTGTHDLLEAWRNSQDVCLGGLFHSIYGTAYYRLESTSLERRPEVAAVIGERAETLAYLFCVTDRRQFPGQLGVSAPVLTSHAAGAAVAVEPDVLVELVEIEVANVLEQIDPEDTTDRTIGYLRGLHDAAREHISEGAAAALLQRIDPPT